MPELNREYTWGLGLSTYMIRPWGQRDDLLCLEHVSTGNLLNGELLGVHILLEHLDEATTYPGFRYVDEHPDF